MVSLTAVKKHPTLRFKGFTDEWKLIRLDNICAINPKSTELPDEFIYIDLESVSQGNLLSTNIIAKEYAPSRAQRILQKGDVLFQTVRPYQKNHYFYKEEFTKPTVASTGFALLRSSSSNEFLYHLLFTSRLEHDVAIRCTGSSYPAINSSDLSEIEVFIPSDQEQQKIAPFFSLLSKKIENQQEKVKQLEILKKGLLQKVFSREVSFKTIDGQQFPEWEEKKLSDFASKITKKNKGFLIRNVISNSSKLGLVSQRDYFDKEIANTENIDGYYVISKGDFVYNPRISTEAPYGPISIYNYEDDGVVSPLYFCFSVSGINNIFLSYYFKASKWHRHIYLNGDSGARHDRVSIKDTEFLNLKFKVPCLEEQEKIADFFTTLDEKIRNEAMKLEELNVQKRGLMQKMFI